MLNSVHKIFVVIPNFKLQQELQRINSYNWGDKVQVLPNNYELELRDMVDFGNKWTTTGLLGLYTICKYYDDIDGFIYFHFERPVKRSSLEMFFEEEEIINKLKTKTK